MTISSQGLEQVRGGGGGGEKEIVEAESQDPGKVGFSLHPFCKLNEVNFSSF